MVKAWEIFVGIIIGSIGEVLAGYFLFFSIKVPNSIAIMGLIIGILAIGIIFFWVDLRDKLKGIDTKLNDLSKYISVIMYEGLIDIGEAVTEISEIDTSVRGGVRETLGKIRGGEKMLEEHLSSSNPDKSRKEILLEQARREEISIENAKELKDLLKKEKKKKEEEGDFLEALVIAGIILFILGLIARLLAEEE